MTNDRQAACGDENVLKAKLQCSLKRGAFYYKIYDLGPEKVFTVHSRGCSPKTNRVISPIVKYTEKMGPRKSVHYKGVFTNQGCSL